MARPAITKKSRSPLIAHGIPNKDSTIQHPNLTPNVLTFRIGFPPGHQDPDCPRPRTCCPDGFKQLVKERADLPTPISAYTQRQIDMAKEYLINGAPLLIDDRLLALEHGVHHFENPTDQALCIDSLAASAAAGYVAGPLPLTAVNAPKLVGAFTREQESSMKKRCISDLSQPRTGGAFNDALSKIPVKTWPMINPGTVQNAVVLILQHGRGCKFTKCDVSSAYKLITVAKEQRRFQVYKFGDALFMELCLCFGDATAAHIFTASHRAIIEIFVLPFISGSPNDLILVVDDTVYISSNEKHVHEYNDRYRHVMHTLKLEVKEHDPNLRKCFHPSTKGEVLGYWLDSESMSWTIAAPKIADALRQTDKIINPENLLEDKPVTLKQIQKVQGKYADFAKLSPLLKTANMLISCELAQLQRHLYKQNDLPDHKQSKVCLLSHKARQDLAFLRAVIASIKTHNLPLLDPRPINLETGDINVFCDASGDTSQPAYLGLLITHGPIIDRTLALSYLLPTPFLLADDPYPASAYTTPTRPQKNHHNSFLLELLCVLVYLVDLGPAFRGTTVTFTSDSLNLARITHKHKSPKGRFTCLALQTAYELAEELQTTFKIHWKPRNSCPYTTAADTLSHAQFHKLPTPLLTAPPGPGSNTPKPPRYATVPLPNPIQRTLLHAATSPKAGFQDLTNLIKAEWRSNGWCQNRWKYL